MSDALLNDDASRAQIAAPVNRSAEEWRMRQLAKAELRARFPRARIVEEFPVRYSTNRIDLAAIQPDGIVGVEIKSSRDTLDRLEAQLRAFEPICGRLIVALAPSFNQKLPMKPVKYKHKGVSHAGFASQFTPAQQIVNRLGGRVETWTVDADQGVVEGEVHGNWTTPHSRRLLDVLHVSELVAIANRRRLPQARRPVHATLAQTCFDLLTGREIIADACAALRARDAFAAGSDDPVLSGEAP